MSLLDNLAHLLQGHHQAQPQRIVEHTQLPQAPQAQQFPQFAMRGMLNQQGQEQWNPAMGGAPQIHPQEDSAQVFGPRGVQALSALNRGEPFMPLGGRTNGARSSLPVLPAYHPRGGASFNGLQQSTSFDGGLQGYTEDDLSNGIQGGVVNQGYIPLQSGRPNPNRYY